MKCAGFANKISQEAKATRQQENRLSQELAEDKDILVVGVHRVDFGVMEWGVIYAATTATVGVFES